MTPAILPVTQYSRQLADKAVRLQHLLSPFRPPDAEIFPSPCQHYRMRAEFRLWHEGERLYHIIFDPQTRQPVRVDQFPAACQQINALMPALLAGIRQAPLLREKIFQIDYLASSRQQAVVSLLYHRPLDNSWRLAALALRDQLRQQHPDLHLIGRASKCKIILDQDYVDEHVILADKTLIYRQPENSFTQPNAAVNRQMLTWAQDVTQKASGDLLELYCGNGNFSLALAGRFRRILATEIAKASVRAAHHNLAVNHVENITILRLSAEELGQALRGERRFNRLQGVDLADYQCDTVLVDPPRAGLDQATLQLIQAYRQILYISCNPDTLCRDLTRLTTSHQIARLALFDQFPYTPHIESGVWLIPR